MLMFLTEAMVTKRSVRHSSSKHGVRKSSWQRVLLLLTVVPLGVGILLIITTLAGFIVWDTPGEQIIMGAFYILFSFAASNAVQKEWKLATGWTLLGIAGWAALNRPEIEAKAIAALLMGIGMALLSQEFLQRRRQALESGTGKMSHPDSGGAGQR
jgi:hypothetical protein